MATLPALAPTYPTGFFDRAPDLSNSEERARLSKSAIRAFVNIAEKWNLTEVQARGLLGGVASSTYHAWRTRPAGKRLDQDTLMRISLVIGIYKALHIYFDDRWSDRWPTLGNRAVIFEGHPPIDYMIREGQPGMIEVRSMLDSWRGGQ
jgi:hypothetical protein